MFTYIPVKPYNLQHRLFAQRPKTINTPSQHKNDQAIGIFDSGVGGLSIAKCIAQTLPNENLTYVADSLHAPYGDKSVDFIIERVNFISEKLLKQGVKALVIACNTATVNAIAQLRTKIDIPIIGVEPAVKPAALSSKNKKVAILVTQATSNNHRFQALVNSHHNGAEVFIQPCPGLVELVEQGQQHSQACRTLLESYLNPLLTQGIDTLVLGCTHYPFVQKQISDIVGSKVHIVETATPVTLQLTRQLTLANLVNKSKKLGQHQFFSTAPTENQQKLISQLWRAEVNLRVFGQ